MAEPFFAKTADDILTLPEILEMSGLEFMQKILDGEIPAPPISKTLNFRLVEVAEGRTVFQGSPRFEAFNPIGTAHGGWYGTILDSAMACAVMTTVPKGSAYTTLEYKVNITRPIPEGMEVRVTGEVDHAGRSTGVASGWIHGVEDGILYATGSTTCLIMKLA